MPCSTVVWAVLRPGLVTATRYDADGEAIDERLVRAVDVPAGVLLDVEAQPGARVSVEVADRDSAKVRPAGAAVGDREFVLDLPERVQQLVCDALEGVSVDVAVSFVQERGDVVLRVEGVRGGDLGETKGRGAAAVSGHGGSCSCGGEGQPNVGGADSDGEATE